MSTDIKTKHAINDIPLENKMECLDINEPNSSSPSCSSEASPEVPIKRTLRRRSRHATGENRRVLTKPIKKALNSSSVENIYLCKQVKRLPPTLETIYEEPKVNKNSELLYIGLRKQKRVILFPDTLPNKGKVKKRQMKVKKMNGKSFIKKKRASMDALLEKLKDID